ncbi:hypothetical protein ICJ04_16895 [Stenotrophomonas sp. 169]|uniref:hypothetical protein n=1 Tax=Stenotrophomonas sp. 169 TaxID=2770322 RepID=UPI001662522B|nr:hypothetical protein [Stenotrophomonas sp. 169]QNR97133.1 hypothetical protein ICJ04_16895 [Stenotrophomonas sp. 169]
MKTAWCVLAVMSLLCAALSTWRLFTAGAGPRIFAAQQIFIAGALASVVCTVVSVALVDTKRRIISAALLASYGGFAGVRRGNGQR